MTITYKNSVLKQSTNGNGTTTAAVDMTGANFLGMVFSDFSSGPASSVSDSLGNTWTKRTQHTGNGGSRGVIYDVVNATVGASQTFSNSGNGSFPCISVAGYGGVKTSSAFDQQNFGTANSGTTCNTGSAITPVENNCLLVFGCVGNSVGALSVDIGTLRQSAALSGGLAFSGSIADEIQTTATARSATFTFTSTVGSVAVIADYKSAPVTFNPGWAYGATRLVGGVFQ